MNKLKNIFYIFFPIVLGSLVGIIISKYMNYGNLIKPNLSPPGWIFPIVWSILYLLMGISYYLYKRKNFDCSITDVLYYMQLFVNILWSIIFFGLKLRFFAIIWIILLLVLVIVLIIKFYNKSKISFYLNIPYLLWIIFATYLTISIYLLN